MTESVQPQTAGSVTIPVIDYEHSQYRADFWVGRGRQYEDTVERLAIRQMLPAHGGRIAEIGAGFGRLADLYTGYEQIILFDYSRTLLQDAARDLRDDPRFVFVAGNLYTLPLASGLLDSVVMVRVMHHLADVPTALQQLRRVMHRHSVGVIEFANKRNLKALLRWGLRRQSWSPLDEEPIEFVELNYDFHPRWMERRFAEADLHIERRYAVSHFRLNAIKARVNAEILARIDSWLFSVGGTYPLAPSVFWRVAAPESGERAAVHPDREAVAQLLRCPICATEPLERIDDDLVACPGCRSRFARRGDVWDLKETL